MSRSRSLFDDIHDPLVRDLVRANVRGAAAVADAFPTPLRAQPVGPATASAHTVRTVGYSRSALVRDTDIPANDGFGKVGRFTY